MTIVRVKKRELPFVQVEKTTVKDPRLSLKATGLLTMLLTFPDDWSIDHRSLARMKRDGEKAVLSALAELRKCGYLHRKNVADSRGRRSWEQWIYEVSDSNPLRAPDSATRKTESPKPALQKRSETDIKSPSSQNRHSVDCACEGSGWVESSKEGDGPVQFVRCSGKAAA